MKHSQRFLALLFVAVIVTGLFIGTGVTSSAAELQTFTYHVPIDSKVKVYFTDNEVFIPTASGEFKVYIDRWANWGFSYADDIHNVLPDYMFGSGIRPVSIEFGMDIDVSWDSGFAAQNTNLNLDPSFKFNYNSTNVRVNSQYPGGYEMAPYYVNYIQDGRQYGSNWEHNLRNAPYTFRFKYSCDTPVSSYDGAFAAWISAFQYGNVAGDDVNSSGYGLEFTVQDFYFTFTFRDETTQQAVEDINSALNDDSFDDNGATSDLEDVGASLTPPTVPDDLQMDQALGYLDDFYSPIAVEMKTFLSAFFQPIEIDLFGKTIDLFDVFIAFLVFFFIGSLVFLVLKGGHGGGGGSKGGDS